MCWRNLDLRLKDYHEIISYILYLIYIYYVFFFFQTIDHIVRFVFDSDEKSTKYPHTNTSSPDNQCDPAFTLTGSIG